MRSVLLGLVMIVSAVPAPVLAGPAPRAATAAGAAGPAPTSASPPPGVPVGDAVTADGRGVWVAATDGTVTAQGDAPVLGDLSGTPLSAPVIGIVASPSGRGYWLLGADGGVFSFGDAAFYGSTGAATLNQPIVGVAPTPTGHGYWLVARDGGVFSFGDAAFYGSTGATTLNQPIVGVAPTPTGHGYWLVARDGGVFSFGDAAFYGSTGALHLVRPVVGVVPTRTGHGYWLVSRDGGVLAFGDAAFHGRATPAAPVIGLITTGDGGGYWEVGGDGGLSALGDAPALGQAVSTSAYSLAGDVVALDPGHDGGNGAHPDLINRIVPSGPGQTKACDTTGTATDDGYTEAAFNFDVATRLAAELRRRGADVVMTRATNDGVGPCVDQRAAIGNARHADAALSIHADGGPPGGSGFAVLEPALFPGFNDVVVGPSYDLAMTIRNAFASVMGVSDYDGVDGLTVRDDLGGLNLSTVPKVLIECGNMRNSGDARLQESSAWRQSAAVSLAGGLSAFLIGA